MVLTDKWETALALDENNANIIITRRIDIDNFRATGKLPFCIEIDYPYSPDATNMPSAEDENLIARMEERLRTAMEKDKLGILTGSYLGGGHKYLVFYCRNVDVFFDRLDEALGDLPELPLSFDAARDPEWEQYDTIMQFEALQDLSAE